MLQDGEPVIYNTKRFRSSLEAWGKNLKVVARFDGDSSPYIIRKELGAEGSLNATTRSLSTTTRSLNATTRSLSEVEGPLQLEIKVAVSGVGTDGALKNLKELDGKDFNTVLAEAENIWEKALGAYSLDSDDKTLRETFYTSVYRTMLHPFIFQDTDGRFREHDGTIGKAEGFTNVTTFSFWDTFRAFEPLMNLVNRPLQADIANSMLAHFDKSAERMLPYWSFYGGETWCMIGYHSCSVLADMILKDVPGFDYERAFQAMKTTATNAHYDCIPEYTSLGYVPFDLEKESVSKTLEYAYDDWCIAQVAKKLGHEEDYKFFLNRSMNYKNLIDPETGYMRGKDSKGAWRDPFAPIAYQGPGSVNGWGDITEGFTMQYTWSVFHDFDGYVQIAGKDRLKKYLDELYAVADKKALAAHLGKLNLVGEGGFFGGGVQADLMDSKTQIFYLGQSGLGMGDRDYYVDPANAELRKGYEAMLCKLFALAGLDQPELRAAIAAGIEDKLAEFSWTSVQNRDYTKLYNPMSSEQIFKAFPGFDFKAFCEAMGIPAQDKVIVEQPSFF
ncbi:MAG: GH92 family glycosyl hydrolase, partial [Bacteroidales bacterium]|nr:GH92 family glycosyl hydrolase [Bacteroidales bacterium]